MWWWLSLSGRDVWGMYLVFSSMLADPLNLWLPLGGGVCHRCNTTKHSAVQMHHRIIKFSVLNVSSMTLLVTIDMLAAPKVFFIQRFHCITMLLVSGCSGQCYLTTDYNRFQEMQLDHLQNLTGYSFHHTVSFEQEIGDLGCKVSCLHQLVALLCITWLKIPGGKC